MLTLTFSGLIVLTSLELVEFTAALFAELLFVGLIDTGVVFSVLTSFSTITELLVPFVYLIGLVFLVPFSCAEIETIAKNSIPVIIVFFMLFI